MVDIESSNRSESETSNDLQAIACSIFSHYGIDFKFVSKAGGWSNEVWVSKELVLRLSSNKENTRLLREGQLAKLFPAEVGYPKIMESGTISGYSWTLAERIPGECLGNVWKSLGWEKRVSALQQLWTRVQAVHTVPVNKAAKFAPKNAWFNTTNAELAEKSFLHLVEEKIFTFNESHVLRDILSNFWRVLPTSPDVLCHGDLTLDNAIWHDDQVVSLLDFEFAVIAPLQLDLNHLIKCAYGPEHVTGTTQISDSEGPFQLQQAVREIALPSLMQPEEKVLLLGYAILLELWLLETWLEHPEGEGPLESWDPLKRLRSLADGNSGYLKLLVG